MFFKAEQLVFRKKMLFRLCRLLSLSVALCYGREGAKHHQAAFAVSTTVMPTDGMQIDESMSLTPGIYQLPNGISIIASNVVVQMEGVILVGTNFTNVGITVERAVSNDGGRLNSVAVMGYESGIASNYYYGMRVVNCDECIVNGLNLSNNWQDPAAYQPVMISSIVEAHW